MEVDVKVLVMMLYIGVFLGIFALADFVVWLCEKVRTKSIEKRRRKQGLYLGVL